MADESFASIAAPVQTETHVAAAAFRDFAALLTLYDRGICPPLPEYQYLAMCADAMVDVVDEFSEKLPIIPFLRRSAIVSMSSMSESAAS